MAPSGWMRATRSPGSRGSEIAFPWTSPAPSWTLCQGFPPICGEVGKFGWESGGRRQKPLSEKPDDRKFPTSPARLKLPSSEVVPRSPCFIVLAWMATSR